MPIYEFACQKCGHRFEELCRLGEGKVSCPACQGKETSRLISAFGFSVKSQNSGSLAASSTSTGGGCAGCSGGSCAGCH